MAEWITVISLVIFGLFLLVLELVFLPGTTVVGFVGLLSSGYGIFLGYDYFGSATGSIILGVSTVVALLAFYQSFRSGIWKKFALSQMISSKVNEDDEPLIIGDVGRALSALRPFGTAQFGEQIREVQSLGLYIDKGSNVRIIQVAGPKVYVEKIEEKD